MKRYSMLNYTFTSNVAFFIFWQSYKKTRYSLFIFDNYCIHSTAKISLMRCVPYACLINIVALARLKRWPRFCKVYHLYMTVKWWPPDGMPHLFRSSVKWSYLPDYAETRLAMRCWINLTSPARIGSRKQPNHGSLRVAYPVFHSG